MVVRTLLEMAMKRIGVLAAGETANANDLADCLAILQDMLRIWGKVATIVVATTKQTFTLVGGTGSYTWGTGGTFNDTRPNVLNGCIVRDSSNYDHPVTVITEGEYRDIADKTTLGRPTRIFLNPSYPLARVYFHPVPDAAESLIADVTIPFTETSSFSSLTDTLAFPAEYNEMILYNLCVRICTMFGKSVTPEILAIATGSYDLISHMNASRTSEPIRDLGIPVGRPSRYDINAG